MLNQLSYRSKNRLLFVSFLVMLFVSYQMAISKTIDARNECEKIEEQLVNAGDAPRKVKLLEKEKQQLYSLMGKEVSSNELQQSLLTTVTSYCSSNKTVLVCFPKPVVSNTDNIALETNVFTVEGSYNKLLELQYLLEKEYRMGKITSVLYKAKRNYDTRKYSLSITIYLQNLISANHEA